jgi:crotonobetaine/carnitine-CoA ligase
MRERNEGILADLIEARAEQTPDSDILTFEHLSLDDGATPDEVRTYAGLWANAQRIAAALVERGLERGERFGLMLRNHPEFVEAMIAASITGGVFVPIDPRTRGAKLEFMLRDSQCRGILCADYALRQVDAARGEAPDLGWVIALETGEGADPPSLSEFAGVASLHEILAGPQPRVDVRVESPLEPVQIMYTSGTTGDPKGVVCPNLRLTATAPLMRMLGYRDDDRPYSGLSLTHANAQTFTLSPALILGLRAVLSRRFTKSRLWDVCRKHGCTTFTLLGGMTTAIYAEPERPNDADNPVRFVLSGGMPAVIWEAFEKRFQVGILEGYGAVEGGFAIKPIGVGPVGSFGKPPPGMEMKVVDEHGNECPPGVVGEIISRPTTGPPPTVEYYGKPEASRRKGGGIRHNGDFINPGFVEKAIAESPLVTDVFVYGVTAASGAPGEKDVVAAIVPASHADFSPSALFASCREKLESNFVPTYLQVVDEIPKTASEKPQERFLLERFAPDGPGVHTEG